MNLTNAGRLFDIASGVVAEEGAKQLEAELHRNLPTTPLGVLEYLDACGLAIRPGCHCLVIGESRRRKKALKEG